MYYILYYRYIRTTMYKIVYVYIYIYIYTQCNKSFVDRYNVLVDRYNYWY